MSNQNSLFSEKFYLTDGGLETSLIYHQGLELNHFAAFELVNDASGQNALETYYKPYLEIANKFKTGFIMETPTWRANQDWAELLGYSSSQLSDINKNSVRLVRSFVRRHSPKNSNIVISGNLGPRGDGYVLHQLMTSSQAERYHREQINAFVLADVDVVSALTLNYINEAVGIVNAAASFNVPVVISFTLETDGRLPSGETLQHAIEVTDSLTNAYASHYMINCAHPNHFSGLLDTNASWKERIKGIRANASTKSHAELDEAETLDTGDQCQLAKDYEQLTELLPNLQVYGGCCGTDHSHIEEICHRIYS